MTPASEKTVRMRRVTAVLATLFFALVAVLPCALLTGEPGLAGASPRAGGSLHSVRCAPLSTDVRVQAPSYAQTMGAGDAPDGWWCELPHATALPAGFVTLQRYVGTEPGTYALYITQYAPKGTNPASATSGPVITLVADASSGVDLPAHLRYPHEPHGKTVGIARHVRAALSVSAHEVSMSWRFPSTGVPRYLAGVVSVEISAHDVSKQTVLAVARSVKPD